MPRKDVSRIEQCVLLWSSLEKPKYRNTEKNEHKYNHKTFTTLLNVQNVITTKH